MTSGVTLTARASGWAAGLGVFLAVANADLALVTTLPTSCRAAAAGAALCRVTSGLAVVRSV